MFRKKYKSKLPFKLSRKEKRRIAEDVAIHKAKNNNPQKYAEFERQGGLLSGVFDISDKRVAAFVKKYREFIPKSVIVKRNKNGDLINVYKY